MASLMHTVTGRKRESDVWQHFQYLDGKKKSKCIVSDNKGKICGFEVCGKNPTNLKSHIRCRQCADCFRMGIVTECQNLSRCECA